MFKKSLLVFLIFCFFLGASDALSKEIQGKDGEGRDYWVYTPDTIDPGKTYTLVVGVHGARGKGKGAAGMSSWVNKHDVIVLGPSYEHNGFQYLRNGSEKQTFELVKMLRKEFKLHPKIFIYGFSGGSQYAHRFAMKHPELVAGCAAHSGGTWATGDYADAKNLNPRARGVLFVISCGEKDTGKSFGEAPLGRLEWAQKYERMLAEGGFVYDAKWIPNVGHSPSATSRKMTEDCFIAVTKRLPEYDAEGDAIKKAMKASDYAGAWQIIRGRLNHADQGDDGILGRVHGLYIKTLKSDTERIDRLGERAVRKIVHEIEEPQELRAALNQHKADFASLPRTEKAIDDALEDIK